MLGLPQLQAFRFLNTIDSLISVSNCYVVWDLDLSPCDVIESVEGEDVREPQKGIRIRERVVITEIQVMFTMPMGCHCTFGFQSQN